MCMQICESDAYENVKTFTKKMTTRVSYTFVADFVIWLENSKTGETLSWVILSLEEKSIRGLYTPTKHRKCGYAKILLRKVIENFPGFSLKLLRSNPTLRNMYQRMGFEVTKMTKTWVHMIHCSDGVSGD